MYNTLILHIKLVHIVISIIAITTFFLWLTELKARTLRRIFMSDYRRVDVGNRWPNFSGRSVGTSRTPWEAIGCVFSRRSGGWQLQRIEVEEKSGEMWGGREGSCFRRWQTLDDTPRVSSSARGRRALCPRVLWQSESHHTTTAIELSLLVLSPLVVLVGRLLLRTAKPTPCSRLVYRYFSPSTSDDSISVFILHISPSLFLSSSSSSSSSRSIFFHRVTYSQRISVAASCNAIRISVSESELVS